MFDLCEISGHAVQTSESSFMPPKKLTDQKLDKLKNESYLRSKGVNPQEPYQLTIWSEAIRALPNDYARSALFTVRNKTTKRVAMEQRPVFHLDKHINVYFTGVELRADDDELVWQQILHYARTVPLGNSIEFSLYGLLKDLGWNNSSRNYSRARLCISRLKACEVRIDNERLSKGIAMSLIRHYEYASDGESSNKRYKVSIPEEFIMLFAGGTYAHITWATYRDLTPMARRLYDYAASHKEPWPLNVMDFHRLCSSECAEGRSWNQQVRRACAELMELKLVKRAWLEKGHIRFER